MFRLPPVLDSAQSRRMRVTVIGVITEIDANQQSESGAHHQIFSVRIDKVLTDANASGVACGELVTVAIRFGGSEGLSAPIPDLKVGEAITLCGAYVPVEEAYPEPDGDRTAVIHFTHHPLGWVEYQGKRYA